MANIRPYEYNFEIETIIKQFVSLLNGAIVMRYDVDENDDTRHLKHSITPSYVCGTKQRVIYDIVNKAKNYTMPCVAISLNGLSYDSARVSAKFTPRTRVADQELYMYHFPTPISLTFDITIFAKYITDLYQIAGKFCTQFQDNKTFSWYVPYKNIPEEQYEELTSKVTWTGEVSFDVKMEKRESDEDKFTAKMNFKVDGWLFPDMLSCNGNIIRDIGTTNFTPDYLNNNIHGVDSYKPLMKDVMDDKNLESYNNPREWNNAHPRIVNIFKNILINQKSVYFLLDKARVTPFKNNERVRITFDGYNLNGVDVLFVPLDFNGIQTKADKIIYDYSGQNTFAERNKITKKGDIIKGYKLNVLEQSNNVLTVDFKDINYIGNFDIVIADDTDYDSLSDKLGCYLTFEP